MKKILLLFLFFQILVVVVVAQNRDANGWSGDDKLETPSALNLLRHSTMLNTANSNSLIYDTVRTISELNDPNAADAYPWLSPDALHLYYVNSTAGNQIMFSQRLTTTAPFSAPVPVSLPVSILSIWLSEDELDYYGADGSALYYGHRTSTSLPFTSFSIITLNGFTTSFFSGPSLDQSQNELYLYVVGAQTLIAQLTRTGPTAFDLVRILPMPANFLASPGQLSKDGLSFFMPLKHSGQPSRLYEYTRASLTDSFTLSSFNLVQGIADTVTWKTQPTVSDNASYLVFAASQTNSWVQNDLYIAHGDEFVSVFNAEELPHVYFSPNPSDGRLNFYTGKTTISTLEIINILGEIIFKAEGLPLDQILEIDLAGKVKGLLICKAGTESGKSKLFKLIIN